RPAKTPLKVLRLLLLGASSCIEEPNKSKEALHELRASLRDFHQHSTIQNQCGSPRESGEAMSVRRSEQPQKGRRRYV
nr:hypothetical protein [Tanacetum cinerariifolium]